ncbi:hypothetical protein RND81_03G073400 [Saponaria officinalis]|uniref:Integrase catalytic domain-containing protein n=1 Tax=Saponaria officinalis TaxID=3572 RepID=A0AAW1LYR0_SAPOF
MTQIDDSATNSDKNYSNPYDDPLYLSNSDFPGVQLLNTVFDGRNYLTWSRSMTMALSSKNKQGFLDGTTAMPAATSPKLQQWRRSDTMVRYWILNSMADELKEGFLTVKSAKALWNDILESCGALENCTCNLLKKVLEQASKEKVITFLMGLNETYDNLRSNILSMEPLPNINKAYSIVQQIESQKRISNVLNLTQDASAFVSEKRVSSGQWRRDLKKPKVDDRWCDFCKKGGHVRDKCFRLHPELRNRFDASKTVAHRSSAYVAKTHDATKEDHPLDFGDGTGTATSGQQNAPVDPALVNAVYRHVMQMMQSNSDGFGNSDMAQINFAGTLLTSNVSSASVHKCSMDWIVDSGATDHMSSQKDKFVNIRQLLHPVIVGLPDGSTKTVLYSGNMQIHPKIMLYDVLFVPDFKHNLISVSKLLTRNGLMINFDMSKCIIQDPAKQAVAVCPKQGGLYKLCFGDMSMCLKEQTAAGQCSLTADTIQSSNDVNNVNKEQLDLMHARLGHTSLSKMQHVPGVIKGFFAQVQKQFGVSIKTVRSDNGTEIVQEFCAAFFSSEGVIHQRSAPGVPQQNGRVERKHRHLVETARAMLLYAGLPKRFWGDCLLSATHIINKLPSPLLNWKTPYEILHNRPPTYDDLRII